MPIATQGVTTPAAMTHILLVDDDVEIGELLSRYLEKFSLRCTPVIDGKAMQQVLATHPVDLILLDMMLPGDDGIALLRKLRAHPAYQHIPVLMLTARDEAIDKIVTLEIGADDYVVKPFDSRELVARIHTILRRSHNSASVESQRGEIRFNQWRLHCQSRQLMTKDNTVIPLSNAEYRLLMAFIERPGCVLSRDQLLDIARDKSSDSFDRSIDLLVSRLRLKLGDDSRQPSLLKTIRGQGYMFQPTSLTTAG